ncbi:MAG: DUF5657 family protein [Patescibacteria group bacterium]
MENLIQALSLSLVVGLLVKVSLVLLTLLSLVTVRQAGLMDRVVSVPIGNWFKGIAWGFFWTCLVLTTGVILIV